MCLKGERLVPSNKKDPFYLEHIQRYQFAKKYIKNKYVLDLGCGVGYGTHYLATHGAHKVIGVDNNRKAIEYARNKFQIPNSKFQISDATKLAFPDKTFDVIVSFEVIEHVKDYKKFIKEALRVLKKGGYFIFSTPNRLQYRRNTSPYHAKEFAPNELKSLFKNLDLYGQFYTNKKFLKSESEYFKRYQRITFGGNKIIKKLLHLIPAELKAYIYHLFWHSISNLKETEIVIKKGNLDRALTLIGVYQKT